MVTVLLVVLNAALVALTVVCALLVLSPRFKLSLITEIGLGLASVAGFGLAVTTVERAFVLSVNPAVHPNHSADGWLVMTMALGVVLAIIGHHRPTTKNSGSLFR